MIQSNKHASIIYFEGNFKIRFPEWDLVCWIVTIFWDFLGLFVFWHVLESKCYSFMPSIWACHFIHPNQFLQTWNINVKRLKIRHLFFLLVYGIESKLSCYIIYYQLPQRSASLTMHIYWGLVFTVWAECDLFSSALEATPRKPKMFTNGWFFLSQNWKYYCRFS